MSDPDKEGWLRHSGASSGWARRYLVVKGGLICIYNVSEIKKYMLRAERSFWSCGLFFLEFCGKPDGHAITHSHSHHLSFSPSF